MSEKIMDLILEKCNKLGEYSEQQVAEIVRNVTGRDIMDLADNERQAIAEMLF